MKSLHTFFLMGALLLAGSYSALAQQTISGKVTDSETDEGLLAVTVVIKGENKGAFTDLDGSYQIEVTDEQFKSGKLVFSFIGYASKEVAIAESNTINVALAPEQLLLEEAVVTAIGIKKDKRKVGYAVTEVKEEELQRSGEINVMNSLNSKVAGVSVTSSSGSPGASTTVRIRGNKSISGSNAPLYVIDGVPVDDSYRGSNFTDQSNRAIDINPDDIESITVLKGGPASALYGVRAGNGAVIITTKSGGEETKINFKSTVIFDQVNKLPEAQLAFGQGEFDEFVEGTRFSWGPAISGESFEHAPNFFQTGITANNYLSFEGGNKRSSFLVSIGNSQQRGIIPNTRYERTNLRLTGKTNWKEKLFVQTNINYIRSGSDRGQRGSNLSGVMLGLMRAPADFDMTNGFEDPVDEPLAYSNPDGTQRTYHSVYDNPYWSVNKNANREDVERVIASFESRLELTENLSIVNRISTDFYDQRVKAYWDARSAEYRDLGGRIYNASTVQRNLNNDFFILYSKYFGEDWEFSATAGHNYFNYETTDVELDGVGFIIPDFYDISNVDIINVIADDFLSRQRGVGAYVDANVGYKGFLFLGLTGRNDWLSNLPADNNSFFYPSVNLGFIFTDAFDIDSKAFSYGKLRASYASVGNGAPSPYLTSNFFEAAAPVQGNLAYEPNSVIGNPDLRPETTETIEFGTDLRFYENRLGLDVTWYRSETTDPIIISFIPSSSGYTTAVLNGTGPIRNTGLELLLNASVVEAKTANQLDWQTSINFNRLRNEVVSIIDGLDELPLPSFGLASTQSTVVSGQPYGVLMGTAWARDANGNVLINDEGYPIVDSERQIIGDPNPDFTAGWRNTLGWRQWSLSFLFDIRVGGDMYNGTANVMRFHGTHIDTENRGEEVVIEGVNVNTGEANAIAVPLDQSYYTRYGLVGVSEEGIEEVNWLRLRDLGITWTMPQEMSERLKIKGASVGIITRNLFLITNYSGIDPETSLSGAANSFGRDYFNSPNTRSYGVQLSLTF
ncbi:SusC/RagA family TonB-linked outer membrane protein [Sanyastnella coralliicola]|uniref:SusC/RagA family TonB-linked outer membrane protein n=1 Tax=Sanyastnella coralliicola TaxID=3069118 RepID=UPI0027B9D61D|nr:SusC/RagA family TonB-linked outer membrane protein [Longitalea sp. SCSIO 12813]